MEAKQATLHHELIAQLLDSRIPKTEREHAAAREIERLRADLLQEMVDAPEPEPVAGDRTERRTPMKTKTADLTDAALDRAVAECRGFDGLDEDLWLMRDGIADMPLHAYTPSTDWAQGGPIIERECIATYASGACSVAPKNPDYWVAEILATEEMITQYGPTPLIAAMRCYVASKLGDKVDIPEELLK